MKRVLLVGYDPETVDFSNPALPSGMSAETRRYCICAKADDGPRMGGRCLFHPS
jgi:hypothetical protein